MYNPAYTPTPEVVNPATGKRLRGAAAAAAAECAARGGMLLSEWARIHGVGRKTAKTMLETGQLRGFVIQKGRLHFYCVY